MCPSNSYQADLFQNHAPVCRPCYPPSQADNIRPPDRSKWIYETVYSLQPSKMVQYEKVLKPESDWSYKNPKLFSTEYQPNKRDQSTDYISPATKSKIKRAIDWLAYMSKPKRIYCRHRFKTINFRLGFLTLTLPSKQIHSDREIKSKCLHQFMVEIRKNHPGLQYVWRGERQQNGNLHIHVVWNVYIYYTEIRDIWNRIISKLGYIENYRANLKAFHANGFKVRFDLLDHWPLKQQQLAYQEGVRTDWYSPNSVDIKSVKHVQDLSSYLSKYLTKQTDQQPSDQAPVSPVNSTPPVAFSNPIFTQATGNPWGCSESISKLKNPLLYHSVWSSSVESYLRQFPEVFVFSGSEFNAPGVVVYYGWNRAPVEFSNTLKKICDLAVSQVLSGNFDRVVLY